MFYRFCRQGELREPAHQRTDRDLRFEPGEGRAETVAAAPSERDVLRVFPADVEAMRVRVGRRVVVGG